MFEIGHSVIWKSDQLAHIETYGPGPFTVRAVINDSHIALNLKDANYQHLVFDIELFLKAS